MKKMTVIFKKHPPVRPLDSLSAIVEYWTRVFGAGGPEATRRDTVMEHCAAAASLTEAVQRACDSKRPNGKIHNHQSRVKAADRAVFAERINAALVGWRGDFDDLHDLCEELAPHGIGPVTVYDVATRIGAYMKLEPTSLYLHAGVRIGWTLLHGCRSPNVKRIPKDKLPAPLQQLPPDEVEDMLCCFREYLNPSLMR